MSTLEVNTITPQSGTTLTLGGSGQTVAIGSGATAGFGKIGQVVTVSKTDTFSTASTSFVDITGLSVSITPTSTSSKILILTSIQGSQGVNANRSYLRLLRDSTPINVGDASGSRMQVSGGFASDHADIMDSSLSTSFLDSPSTTSSITYKWQGVMATGTQSLYINRSQNDTDQSVMGRGASSMTLMEVLA